MAHVIVDGAIDIPWIRENFGEAIRTRGPDAMSNPDHIAGTNFAIHEQARNAWTFELDLRPWVENW